MTDKLRWGFLSTARINGALIQPLRDSRRNTLTAVASRSQEKADAYARKNKIKRAYGSYEALLADREIDVVYNALPNHLHAEWTIKAVEAGKHILCEKPFALSVDEVDAMTAAAQKHGKVVAEALMYRSHPQLHKVRELVREGKLGEIKMVNGSYTYPGVDAENYRLQPEMGGGALWDVGIYPLSYARALLGEPLEVFGWQVTGPTGVDETFTAQLRFPGNVYTQLNCSMALPYHTYMEIVGSEATLVIPTPYNPGLKCQLYTSRKGKTDIILVKGMDTYAAEVEDMARAILDGAPSRVTLEDSRANVAAVRALFESARTGKPVTL